MRIASSKIANLNRDKFEKFYAHEYVFKRAKMVKKNNRMLDQKRKRASNDFDINPKVNKNDENPHILSQCQLPISSDEDDVQMSQESVTMSSGDIAVLKLRQSLSTVKSNVMSQYDLDLKVKFMVLCEVIPEKDGTRKNIFSNLYFAELMEGLNQTGLLNITMLGKGRAKLVFDTALNANNFIKQDFSKHTVKAFIPTSFTQKFGVIRHVPEKYSEDYLMEKIESSIGLASVQRLKRRVNGELIPTGSVKLGFKGDSIPKQISLNLCLLNVDYFVPAVKQCRKCGLLGHIETFCKSKNPRCLMCGKSPHPDTCDSSNCILCGSGDHVSTFFKCPVRIEQQNIKKCMTIENLSYKEYQIKYGNENRFDILSNKEYENHFPDTLNANRNKNNRNKQEEVNRSLTSTRYSKVVLKKPSVPVPQQNFPVVQHHVCQPSSPVVNNHIVSQYEKFVRGLLDQFAILCRNMPVESTAKEFMLTAEKNFTSLALQSDLDQIASCSKNTINK